MWRIIVLCTIANLAVAQKSTFVNYKVFNIVPLTREHIKLLEDLEQLHDGFSFWEEPTLKKTPVKLMVAPHKLPEFYEIMDLIGVFYELFIDNVQELVNQTTQSVFEFSPYNPNIFPFFKYPTYNDISYYLSELLWMYSDKIELISAGESYENNSIFGVKVSFNNETENPGIILEGGTHANEWISPVTVLYILHQLMTSADPDVRALAESHNWYVFPLLNPDGYKYTHTTNRLWRKSRKPYTTYCIGVDLNRNWGYKWNSGAVVNDACSNKYAGPKPFSEPETMAMKNYIDSISNKFYAYISFHSSSQILMFPYGYTTSLLDNYNQLYTIGLNATAALKQKYGTEYRVGNVAETVHFATGTSIDYVKGTYKKFFVYSYNLRDRNYYSFLLPPDQIIPTGEETLDSLVSMFKQIKASGYYGRDFDTTKL